MQLWGYYVHCGRSVCDNLKHLQMYLYQAKNKKPLAFSLLFLVLPYLPASNLFFPVGFVLAERTLYTPW